MKFQALLGTALLAAAGASAKTHTQTHSTFADLSAAFPNLSARARTPLVAFDNYSLSLAGQRVFLHSGEFHTFRLPVPSLWPDILQKAKAAGLNGISVYTHMGAINPAPGVVDFNDWRALQPLYEAAMEAGIWVVLRPGPYINAETTAGGIAHWITTQVAGQLRTSAADWEAAWQAYIAGIINQTEPFQISHGGPVIAVQIDNEYQQRSTTSPYYTLLEETYRNASIDVPLTYNDAGERSNFINGSGAVDLYGLDAYPQLFDCAHPTKWNPVVTNYLSYHERVNPAQPFYFPEFQGGSFDAWGPGAPGYPACAQLTGPEFQSVFNRQLWASNVKLLSYYMLHGGTNWGAFPFHGVYTSYDYGASIAENRAISTKFSELKLQGIFLRSSPAFYKTNFIGDTSAGGALPNTTNVAAFVSLLTNPDTKTGFYVLRQTDGTSTAITNFNMTIATSLSPTLNIPLVTPTLTISGRESKLILTNYAFGGSTVDYTTAQVFFAGKIGTRDVLFLYGQPTESHELRLALTGTPNTAHQSAQVSRTSSVSGTTILGINAGLTGLSTLYDSSTQLVLYADYTTAATFWAPVISSGGQFGNFWSIGSNSTLLVGGPYLVRTAAISGSTLALVGDLNATSSSSSSTVPLSLIVPPSIKSITWNGAAVAVQAGISTVGGWTGTVGPRTAATQVKIPALTGWRYADSLPEVQSGFSDAGWVTANHTSTNIPFPMYYGDGRVLYGCDYGFCENIVLWRGHFNAATSPPASVNLSINGGEAAAFAASVWLNDVFLGTSFGNSSNNRHILEETDDKFTFPAGSVKTGDNVITIVQDNMGLNETINGNANTCKSPRGVRGFALTPNTTSFGSWKVQGKVGGYLGFPDKTRGIMNEGGLFGERAGWHLPGFDTSAWVKRDLLQGLPGGGAGVGFFVTELDLAIPAGTDVFLSFTFEEPLGQAYRAYLFVNGWMMGKRVANLGPQAKFPVHQGILNFSGKNTVAVALWSMSSAPVTPNLQLVVDGVLDGGVPGGVTVNNPAFSSAGRV
ncbi:unnamed protein product [Mycena citricolor]|uniref:beta-galactosidase n=1 Tax=Mycena citricolor TaxID=2018698 RepID=A0AAD2Q414_9AGAR|nr:unnamed protein product [Mycena citricolor]